MLKGFDENYDQVNDKGECMFQKTYDDDDSEGWTPSESDSESDDDAPTDYTNMAAYFLKDK